jgi:hypothetical protein
MVVTKIYERIKHADLINIKYNYNNTCKLLNLFGMTEIPHF